MKKQLVASLAAAMVLGVAGTSFAATNPFTDVPAKHWSYDAVTTLAKAGVVDGYGDGTFKGDKMISRYEMAQIVAKAMAHSDKATAEQKATIDKLSVEFASELEGLNVRVTKVESKMDKFDLGGAARIRYDHVKDAGVQAQNINLDINYTYKVNEDWAVKGESEWNRDLRDTNTGNDKNGLKTTANDQFEQMYVTGPIGGTTVKAGKFSYLPTYGLIFDDKVSGAQVSFGNVLKTTLTVGKTNANNGGKFRADLLDPTTAYDNLKYEAIDAVWTYSKDTNIKANYSKITSADDQSYKAYEVGFDTKLSKDFSFQAAYAKSDADINNKAYFAQVQYKAADTNVVGSSDIYLAYRKFQQYATIAPTGDWTDNYKGVRVGFDYVPMKNAKFATWYQPGTTANDGASTDAKTFRAQVELFF